MKTRSFLLLILPGWLFSSCGVLQQSTLHGLRDGYFISKNEKGEKRKVYATVSPDSLSIFPVSQKHLDTGQVSTFPLLYGQYRTRLPRFTLIQSSMDLDVTTVLFKYRFRNKDLPGQLNTNFNLSVYMGYKKEYFKFSNQHKPTGYFNRKLVHLSMDAGLFCGLGSTNMNSSVTSGRLSVEYDGLIWQKGVAVFFGWENITIGLGLGFDGLLDKNRHYWIYQEKPWAGLMIGLTFSN